MKTGKRRLAQALVWLKHIRLWWIPMLAVLLSLVWSERASAQPDALPAWNDGPTKQAIFAFVRATTDKASPSFVRPEERVVTFDQDGTLWVSHPMYLSGNREAIEKLSMDDLKKILEATLTGMSVEDFGVDVKRWLATAKHPRWKRPYTDLAYQPMLELLGYLRANGFKTYIATGGGQDFVRVYAEEVYGIPREQVIGSMGGTSYEHDKNGRPFLTKEPKLLLNDDNAGKPEGIWLMIGRQPLAAFGNSTGDREMLEYAKAGSGARLAMLVLHDDAQREFAYGPAQGLPDTKIGTFPQALHDEAKERGWVIISMKKDWKRLFSFEK